MKILLIVVCSVLLVSCSSVKDDDFVGSWSAMGGFTKMNIKCLNKDSLNVLVSNSKFTPFDKIEFRMNKKNENIFIGEFINVYGKIHAELYFNEKNKKTLILDLTAQGEDNETYYFEKINDF